MKTAFDIVCNYAVVCDVSFSSRGGTWHLTGAYEDVQMVSLIPHPSSPIPHPFAFPLGSDLCTSLWAFTWGKVRPQLKNASNEIAVVGTPMSAIPEVSRFWTAATSNDTYLLTWEDFAVGRHLLTTNNQQLTTLSAQIELFRNGDFITRSNMVESVWRRTMPCDLDEDGWLESIDPNPTEFDEAGFGPHQTLPEGDDTNYHQIFTFNAMGDLRIDKFSQWIECSAGGCVSHSQGVR